MCKACKGENGNQDDHYLPLVAMRSEGKRVLVLRAVTLAEMCKAEERSKTNQ